MRYILIIIFVLSTFHIKISCNTYANDIGGISLFDNYLSNPSFIYNENFINLDFYGRAVWTKYANNPSNYMVNSIISIEKIKSGFRLAYNFSPGDLYKVKGFDLGYSYKYNFNDQVGIACGLNYSYSRILSDWSQYIDYQIDDSEIKTHIYNSHHLDFGLGINLHNLTVGLNSNFQLKGNQIFNDGDLPDSVSTTPANYQFLNYLLKYDFLIFKKFTLTPQFNYNEMQKAYLSLFISYNDKYKLGLTYATRKKLLQSYNLLMFSGSCIIAKRVELILFFNPGFQKIYDSEEGWNLMGKIGFKF